MSKNPDDLVFNDSQIHQLQEAWFAVKHATLVEKTFIFNAEEEFGFQVVHQNEAEALNYWVEKWGPGLDVYNKLDTSTKAEIDSLWEDMTAPNGVFVPEKAVLTVLQNKNQ